MAHRPINNKSTENLNRQIYFWFRNKLIDYFLAAYDWEGFPFDKAIYPHVMRYMNKKLLYTGIIGFTYVDDSFPIVGGCTEAAGKTWYGASYKYNITTETDTFTRSIDDMAICYNTPSKLPMINTINIYSDILTSIFLAMKVNYTSQNTPAILRAPSGKELTYSNAYEQIAGHKAVVYGRDDIFNEDDKPFFYLQPGQFVADKLWLEMTNMLNLFFFDLGAMPLPFEKKAQVQSVEVEITKQPVDISANTLLGGRKEFCERINQRYGLNTSVRITYTSEYARKQVEAMIAENPFNEVNYNEVLERV